MAFQYSQEQNKSQESSESKKTYVAWKCELDVSNITEAQGEKLKNHLNKFLVDFNKGLNEHNETFPASPVSFKLDLLQNSLECLRKIESEDPLEKELSTIAWQMSNILALKTVTIPNIDATKFRQSLSDLPTIESDEDFKNYLNTSFAALNNIPGINVSVEFIVESLKQKPEGDNFIISAEQSAHSTPTP